MGEVASITQMVQKYATSVHPVRTHIGCMVSLLMMVPWCRIRCRGRLDDDKGRGMPDAELDAVVWCWLNTVTLLLALKTGQLLVVQSKLDRDTVHDIVINTPAFSLSSATDKL